MDVLTSEIRAVLEADGYECVENSRSGISFFSVSIPDAVDRYIVPCILNARSQDEAAFYAGQLKSVVDGLIAEGKSPIVITEDRWRSHGEMMKARLLAHVERFVPMYARNCEIRRIDKQIAADFLDRNHSYGDASCRYRYGMFLKRYTGRSADVIPESVRNDFVSPGALVAVATFSNARKWKKGDKEIRSYEWTRYASLPGVRISGGMGKMLKKFIQDVKPDDVMSYADLEWSEGKVYEQLGFALEGRKEPVTFEIDSSWRRIPIKCHDSHAINNNCMSGKLFYQNLGSNKYRLKLTEYE